MNPRTPRRQAPQACAFDLAWQPPHLTIGTRRSFNNYLDFIYWSFFNLTIIIKNSMDVRIEQV